jgi:hypothetical protein
MSERKRKVFSHDRLIELCTKCKVSDGWRHIFDWLVIIEAY